MNKRLFDIIFSLLVLILFFWALLFSWFISIIDTRTNGIFIQQRIGQYGKKFDIYKLRTIRKDQSGEEVISSKGRLLRKYKLDELPQFFNVLRGTMSVIGARPDIVGYSNLLKGEDRKILELKPGLSSLASLKYINEEEILEKQREPLLYNDTVIFPDKVKMNLEYYYSHSIKGDFIIILKTVQVLFFRSRIKD